MAKGMEDKTCRHWLVSGRVQGVSFRAATRDQALALGLDGSACNLGNGQVEVFAYGAPAALDQLETWLQRGPPAARVDAVMAGSCFGPLPTGFTTG